MANKSKKNLKKRSKSTARKSNVKLFSVVGVLFVLACIVSAFYIVYKNSTNSLNASYDQNTKIYTATFNGNPSTPEAISHISQDYLDIAVHSRDIDTFNTLHTLEAHHGPDCGAPLSVTGTLVTHPTDGSYEGTVFKCKDHVMTAMNEGGYGVIYLTPTYMADISSGAATIKFDVSTYRSSSRDWIDLWLTPYEDNMQLPLDAWLPDLQGTPKNGIHIKEDQGIFKVYVIRDYVEQEITINTFEKYDSILTPSPKDRATFELQISKNHIKFGIPGQTLTNGRSIYWADTTIPDLTWTNGVVQLGHHSYNPEKDCNVANTPGPDGTCKPNTWHWDNIFITNATPFTIIKGDKRTINDPSQTLTFQSPAPADSYLRFSAIGTVETSYDNGATWSNAARQHGSSEASGSHHPNQFSSYWTPIPVGTSTVKFRFSADGWYNGAWPYLAKDFAIWSKTIIETPTSTPPNTDPTSSPIDQPSPTPTTIIPSPTPTIIPSPTPIVTVAPIVTIQRTISIKQDDTSLVGSQFYKNITTTKLGKDGAKGANSFNLYPSLNIPRGAKIVNAYINYELVGFGGGTVNVIIAAHNTGNATTPADKKQFQSKQSQLTSFRVNWNSVQQGEWGTIIQTPNIASIIQQIVNRSDWNAGNAILLWLGDNNSQNWAHSSYMTADFTGAGQKPTLTITYTQ